MGLSITFDGVPATRVTRLQNAFKDIVGKDNADDVTGPDIEDWIKLQIKKKVREHEKSVSVSQAEQEFNENFVNPL